MSSDDAPRKLRIRKYANRRFYDMTRSRHVTLAQMHELIQEGHDLEITDSKTGEDITQVVLTQLILEHDPPKLGIFPANVLHEVIRTQQELLGTVVEQFFAQVLASHKASQEQWARFLNKTLGLAQMPTGPLEWTRTMMEAMVPRPWPPADGSKNADQDAQESSRREIEALREQVADLSRRVERLAADDT